MTSEFMEMKDKLLDRSRECPGTPFDRGERGSGIIAEEWMEARGVDSVEVSELVDYFVEVILGLIRRGTLPDLALRVGLSSILQVGFETAAKRYINNPIEKEQS